MIRYKIVDFERLEKEFEFLKATLPLHGDVLYRPMPNKSIVLYVVIKAGSLWFERNVVGKKSSTDFDELADFKTQTLEDYMKATRLVAELEFNKVIEKVVEDEKL